jgi:hypothetical protein
MIWGYLNDTAPTGLLELFPSKRIQLVSGKLIHIGIGKSDRLCYIANAQALTHAKLRAIAKLIMTERQLITRPGLDETAIYCDLLEWDIPIQASYFSHFSTDNPLYL